jgi:dihydrofolate reductase
VTAAVVALVVARAKRGVIGAGGKLPWRLPTDMARFRAITLGKPVVMGRRTWASLRRPLAGRDNIVVSRNPDFRPAGGWVFASLEGALACAQARAAARKAEEVCVIGGAEIYRAALPLAQRLHVTEVDAEVAGDTYFPKFNAAQWREVSSCYAPAGKDDDHAMTFRILERAP